MRHALFSFIATAFLVVGQACAAGVPPPSPSENVCGTKVFRDAFLDGQRGVIDDYTGPSAGLVAMGDEALPCLEGIVHKGGVAYGISGCLDVKFGCEGWAVTAIRKIGTADARAFLVGYLDTPKDPYLTVITARALGSLRETSARPGLLRRLSDVDLGIRAEAIAALGAIGEGADLSSMLQATVNLPDEHLYTSLQGFRMMGNPTVLDALRRRVERVEDGDRRTLLQRSIDQWESEVAEVEKVLAVLKAGPPSEIVAALRRSSKASPTMLASTRALLDSPDPDVRAEAVVSLGRWKSHSDFAGMLKVVLALPEERVTRGAEGLILLADPRAIDPLQRYASSMSSPAWRQELQRAIDGLRQKTTPSDTSLTLPN